jgi:hypothetical protein
MPLNEIIPSHALIAKPNIKCIVQLDYSSLYDFV